MNRVTARHQQIKELIFLSASLIPLYFYPRKEEEEEEKKFCKTYFM